MWFMVLGPCFHFQQENFFLVCGFTSYPQLSLKKHAENMCWNVYVPDGFLFEEGSTTNSCPTGSFMDLLLLPFVCICSCWFFHSFSFLLCFVDFLLLFFLSFSSMSTLSFFGVLFGVFFVGLGELLWRPPFALSLCFCFCLCFSLCKGYTSWPLQVRISPILFSCVCFIFF